MWLEQVIGVPLNVLILCLLAGATRVALQHEAMTVKGVISILLSALLLSLIAYPLLVDEEYGSGRITFLVAVGSFGARDIFLALLLQFKKNPWSLIMDFLDWKRSRTKLESEEDEK